MVNSNLAKMGSIVIIVLLVGAFVIANSGLPNQQSQTMDYDEGASESESADGSSSTFTASMYAYDEDGNVVPITDKAGSMLSAFRIGENYVTKLAVGLQWNSVGVGIDWTTLQLTGAVKIYYQYYSTPDADKPSQALEYQKVISSTEQSASEEYVFVLGEHICLAEHIQDGGTGYPDYWYLVVKVTLAATVEDILGLPLSDSLEFSGSVLVYWDAAYDLTGGWTPPTGLE